MSVSVIFARGRAHTPFHPARPPSPLHRARLTGASEESRLQAAGEQTEENNLVHQSTPCRSRVWFALGKTPILHLYSREMTKTTLHSVLEAPYGCRNVSRVLQTLCVSSREAFLGSLFSMYCSYVELGKLDFFMMLMFTRKKWKGRLIFLCISYQHHFELDFVFQPKANINWRISEE